MSMIRCPGCRGAKKVPKLGGMIGECNQCNGVGQIHEGDKPKPVVIEAAPITNAVIKAVADCVPASDIPKSKEFLERRKQVLGVDSEDKQEIDTIVTESVKIDGKKALYKRKTVAK